MDAAEYVKQQGKPELQALAGKRGLSTSGTKEEIAARLEQWDNQHPPKVEAEPDQDEPDLSDLLALQQPLPPVASTEQQTGGQPPQDPTGAETGAAPEDSGAPDGAPGGGEADGEASRALTEQHRPPNDEQPPLVPVAYRWETKLEAEFTDELHDRYRQQAHTAAVEAGKTPRVGPYGARLVSLDGDTAVYEVPIRRG